MLMMTVHTLFPLLLFFKDYVLGTIHGKLLGANAFVVRLRCQDVCLQLKVRTTFASRLGLRSRPIDRQWSLDQAL